MKAGDEFSPEMDRTIVRWFKPILWLLIPTLLIIAACLWLWFSQRKSDERAYVTTFERSFVQVRRDIGWPPSLRGFEAMLQRRRNLPGFGRILDTHNAANPKLSPTRMAPTRYEGELTFTWWFGAS